MYPPSSTLPHALVALFTALLATACGAGTDADSGFAVRDSAGLRIVENRGPTWDTGDGWRLSRKPTVLIGVVEGDAHYQFSNVRDMARLSDGRIAVANGGSGEIRIYGQEGAFLRAFGDQGGGPGEFQYLSGIEVLPGDSILAYDYQTHRLTVFGPDGVVARTTTLEWQSPALLSGLERLSDGTIVLSTASGWSSRQLSDDERRDGLIYREPSPILRYSVEGVLLDTIGVFPGLEIAVWGEGRDMTMGIPLFGHVTVHATFGERIYIGTQETYEIRVYSPGGDVRELIRGPSDGLVVTEAAMEAARQALLQDAPADMPNPDSVVDAYLASRPMPDTPAAYERILIDALGNLWVGEAVALAQSEPTAWTVFNPDGRMLGRVDIPDLRLFEIGADYVLGRWQDEFDVQYVRSYALIK